MKKGQSCLELLLPFARTEKIGVENARKSELKFHSVMLHFQFSFLSHEGPLSESRGPS